MSKSKSVKTDTEDSDVLAVRKQKSKSIVSFKDMTEEEQRLHRNAEILRMMPDNIADALAKARYKPIWCSDMRWRMELARRKRARMGF